MSGVTPMPAWFRDAVACSRAQHTARTAQEARQGAQGATSTPTASTYRRGTVPGPQRAAHREEQA